MAPCLPACAHRDLAEQNRPEPNKVSGKLSTGGKYIHPGGHIERCTSSMKGAGGRECVKMGLWIDVGCGLCACGLTFKDKRERVGSGGSSTQCATYNKACGLVRAVTTYLCP